MKAERKKEEDKKMIGERDDPKGSSAAIEEIANKYDSDDSTAKDKTEHEKEEIICGPELEVGKNPDETTREVKQAVEAIGEVVFQDMRKGNFDKLGNRSSNTLGMRVKDSFIIIVQQTQRKAVPSDGLRASQLACQLRRIDCEDGKVRVLPSPRIESPAPSSESESLSTRQKKSVSLAENVDVFNHRLENEVFIESEAGIVIGEPRIDDRENAAESVDKTCGSVDEKSPPDFIAESVSSQSVSVVNVGEETEVENLPVELSVTVNKSYPSLASKIACSQENSTSKINENFTLQFRETEPQLAKGGTPQIAGYTDREKLFSEMSESIECIVENLDDDTELPTDKSDEGAAVDEESKRANEYAREESTSDVEEGVEQLEPVIGERKSETIDDVRKAENESQEISIRSVKCSENFKKEDSTFSLNAFIAMLDSASMSLQGDSGVRILETEVPTMDHIGNEKSKNNDDDRGIAICSPDQRFSSESSSGIFHKINAEKLSEEFEIRFENSVESKHVDGEKSLNSKNATLLEDRDDIRGTSEPLKEDFIAAIFQGENLVAFATVSLRKKTEKESENLIGNEAAVSPKVQMEVGETNVPKAEKSSNCKDLDDDFDEGNKGESQSGSSSERLSRQNYGLGVRRILISDEKVNVESAAAEARNSSPTSGKKTFSKVSIKRRKFSKESLDTEENRIKFSECDDNGVMKFSGTGTNNEAINLEGNANQAFETSLDLTNNKNAPNTIEEMELVEENYVQDKKCGEKDSSEVIRAQEIQTSVFSLQCEKSPSTLHRRRKERTEPKSTESWDKIKVKLAATGNAHGEIRKRSRDRRTRESAKKFVNSLSQIFGNHSARKRNATKPSSSQMKPRKRLQTVETTLASSDDREIGKKSANVKEKDDGEELVAVESFDLTNNTKETTNHEFPAAAASKNVAKNFSSEDQEANKLLVNSNVAEETKNIPEERLEKPSSRNNRLEKKQRKSSSGKSFAMIRKFFSKPLTKSKNETEHRIQKELCSVKRAEEKTAEEGNEVDRKQQTEPEATKQVSDDLEGQQNRREVPSVDTSGAGVVVNKVEPNYEQQVSCPESRKDKRYIWLLSAVRSTNSRSIDHLERVEMRISVEKNVPDVPTTPSIENGVKRMKGKGANKTESVFSRTMKRLFKQRGSAADSINPKRDTCSISSRNQTLNTVVVTGTNESRQGCKRDESFRNGGFVVFDAVVTDRTRNLINREEICGNFNNDHENCFTSEPKSMVSLLRTRMAKKSLDALTEAFYKPSKRSTTISSEDNIIESFSRIQNSTRNTFPTAFMTEDKPPRGTLTLTRDIESIPSGRRKSIVVMMATPETSNTSNNQRGSSSSSPTAF